MVVATLGDTYPFLGVVTSPLLDPKGTQGEVGAVLPNWLPLCPVETSMESPLKGRPEGPTESSLKYSLESLLLNSPLLCMAQLVKGSLQRQPWVFSTRLPLPRVIVSHRVVPRPQKAGSKQAKCPAPDSTPRMEETSPRDNIPPKKRKKVVLCQVVKHSKTPWEEKLKGDGMALGSSRQHVGCSKWRASDSNNMPTKRPRTLGDERSAPRSPNHC